MGRPSALGVCDDISVLFRDGSLRQLWALTMNELVFVYGTLKRGYGNHSVIDREGNQFVSEAFLRGPFKMISLGAFPGVVEDTSLPDAEIQGEVFRVAEDNMAALDALEGNGRFYTRYQRQIWWPTEDPPEAWVYLLPFKDYRVSAMKAMSKLYKHKHSEEVRGTRHTYTW